MNVESAGWKVIECRVLRAECMVAVVDVLLLRCCILAIDAMSRSEVEGGANYAPVGAKE